MTGAPDTSGSKNSIQSRGSAVSYLQRYSLVGALGLTTADEDMDARMTKGAITSEQAQSIRDRLQATDSDATAFCKAMNVPDIEAIPASRYGVADSALAKKEKKHAGN